MLVLALMNRRGVTSIAAYLLVGLVMWTAVLKSGVHATLAGVLLALFIPLKLRNELPNGCDSWPSTWTCSTSSSGSATRSLLSIQPSTPTGCRERSFRI